MAHRPPLPAALHRGRFEGEGNTIVGRWEKAEDGKNYQTDFDPIYPKVK